jgi:hypothetical protein
MNAVVVDTATRDKLLAAGNGVVAVQDESGRLIGRFVVDGPPTPPAGYVIEGEWPSDEEIDRRLREDKRYSVAEVEAFLKGLRRATP